MADVSTTRSRTFRRSSSGRSRPKDATVARPAFHCLHLLRRSGTATSGGFDRETFFAGLILYLNRPWLLFALVPVAIMQLARARAESRVLEERFGDEYRAYRARTWF
jgi:hypothetical protein